MFNIFKWGTAPNEEESPPANPTTLDPDQYRKYSESMQEIQREIAVANSKTLNEKKE